MYRIFFIVTFCDPFEKLIKAICLQGHVASKFSTILECSWSPLIFLPYIINSKLKLQLKTKIIQLLSVCSPIPRKQYASRKKYM